MPAAIIKLDEVDTGRTSPSASKDGSGSHSSSKRRACLGPLCPSSAALREAILFVSTDGEVCKVDFDTDISPAKRPCGPVVAMCRDTGEWEVITEAGRIPLAKAMGRFEQLQREVVAAARATVRGGGALSRPSSSSSLSSLATYSEAGFSDTASALGTELLGANDHPVMSEIDEMLSLSLDSPVAKELLEPQLDERFDDRLEDKLDVKFEPGELFEDVLATLLDGMCSEADPKASAGDRRPSAPSSPSSSSSESC